MPIDAHVNLAPARRRRADFSPHALLLTLAFILTACSDPAPPPASDAPRIVCLAPTLTKMLADLGELGHVVGVGQYDTAAPPDATVVGNYVGVDVERLLSVRPTLVLTMAGKEGVPPRLRELAGAGRFELRVWPNPDPFGIEHVTAMLLEVGDAVGRRGEAEALRAKLTAELDAVRAAVNGRPSPRVLLVIGTNPVMACGPDTAHDQMLHAAGGVNAAAAATVTAPTFDREALIAMQPDVVLLLQPDAPPLTDDDERLRAFRGLPIPAVANGRVTLLNDPLVLLTSTSIAHTVRLMARAIHPDLELPDVE